MVSRLTVAQRSRGARDGHHGAREVGHDALEDGHCNLEVGRDDVQGPRGVQDPSDVPGSSDVEVLHMVGPCEAAVGKACIYGQEAKVEGAHVLDEVCLGEDHVRDLAAMEAHARDVVDNALCYCRAYDEVETVVVHIHGLVVGDARVPHRRARDGYQVRRRVYREMAGGMAPAHALLTGHDASKHRRRALYHLQQALSHQLSSRLAVSLLRQVEGPLVLLAVVQR